MTLCSWTDSPVDVGQWWYRAVVTDGELVVETNFDDAVVTGIDPEPEPEPDPVAGMIKRIFFHLEPNKYYWFHAVLFYDEQEIDDSENDSFVATAVSASAVECKFILPDGIDSDVVIGWYASAVDPASPQFITDDFRLLGYSNVNGDSVLWNETLTNTIEYNHDIAWLSQPEFYSVTISKIGVVTGGENPLFLARIERGPETARKSIRPHEVDSINYSVLRRGTYLSDSRATQIAEHQSVDVPVFPWILEAPVKDYGWNADSKGYNFIHCIDKTIGEPFPTTGNYEVTYQVKLKGGQGITIKFSLSVQS